ncbi:MAG TPA: DEAD/DEAH box helicase, partial [Thermoanaerobaculia bacterium]|nr:DEAD/DEAH box helicase [Thermoanaerobaculia bacterium]
MLRGIKELGFTRPTPIQTDAIPPALAGKDVLAAAATGSGKTAAFLLPILHRLMPKKRGTTRALIITPTRELAAQIDEHLRDLAVHTPISGAAVFGGVGMGPQEHAFRSGVDVLVATPGRLLDHFQRPYAKLDGLEILVLDEADRMLDRGFVRDMRRIVAMLPAKRQSLLFSATMPAEIARIAAEFLKSPERVSIRPEVVTIEIVDQEVIHVDAAAKPDMLTHLLSDESLSRVIVFTRTKHGADKVKKRLAADGVSVLAIHGNKSQSNRQTAIRRFREGAIRVLVATDVAARGIDVADISHVINYDIPNI